MDASRLSRKELGDYGEKVTAMYLKRKGFRIVARNIARKTGEIDVLAQKGKTLYFVEVKTNLVKAFPTASTSKDAYDPSANLHEAKIRRVARTSEWYVAEHNWEGDWQVDGCLVWVRAHDGAAKVSYFPQIL